MNSDQQISNHIKDRSNMQSRWLLWLTHLKKPGGNVTEHDIGYVLPAISWNDSVGKGKKLNCKQIEAKDMKAKNQILKGLAMLLLLFVSTMGVMALTDGDPTSTTPTQSVCPGTEPYKIIPDNAANTFLWSISPGTSGVEWTISAPTAAITDIIWANPATPQVYTVTFKELAATGCFDEVTLVVTVNPRPNAPTASDLTECEKSPIQTLLATATAPTGATVVWYDAATGGNVVASPTLSAVGSITYYAESVLGSCSSLTRTAVKLTIEPAPLPPTASDQTACEQNPLQTLTATATPPTGATVVWYDAATAGNIVASPTLSAVGSITYYAQSNLGSCTSLTRTAVKLTIEPAPLPPTASDQTECEKSPLQVLTATATPPAGATVVWYDAPTAGNIVATPTLTTVGTITYYAQSNLGACTSLTRTAVKLTIEPAPLPPTASDQTECEKSPLQVLTATATPPAGATVVWYDAATGGNIVASPTLNIVGTITYYAQSNQGACSSLTRTAVKLTIEPAPLPPTASDQTECEKSPLQVLTATATPPTGATVVWYDAPTGGNIVTTPTLTTVGTITYYAQSNLGSCSSLTRTAVKLTIEPAPLPPTASDLTECEKSPLQVITATATPPAGATVVWYDAATGGNIVASPTLNIVGTITYYAQSNQGACTSLTRTPVKLTIEPAPAAPTASDVTDCEQNPLQTLTATATPPTGATVVWYDAATGGNIVTTPILSIVGSITYYAQSNLGSCTSLTRTPVKLTILPAPAAPTASDITDCEKSPLQTITATATPPTGATVVWYDAATGGNIVASPTLSAVGSITYYAESVLGSCKSLTRTAVKLTIEPAPVPTVTGPTPICAGTTSNVYTTESGMTNYIWAISAGGTITAGGTATDNTVTVTWNTAGAQTVSVNYTNAKGCAGLTPTIKAITVDPLPKTSPIYHN